MANSAKRVFAALCCAAFASACSDGDGGVDVASHSEPPPTLPDESSAEDRDAQPLDTNEVAAPEQPPREEPQSEELPSEEPPSEEPLNEAPQSEEPPSEELRWLTGTDEAGQPHCAEVAAVLPGTQLPELAVRSDGVATLQVRVKTDPDAAVPPWSWQVEHIELAGVAPEVMALDGASASVRVTFDVSGLYEIAVHSHYPGMNACFVRALTRVSLIDEPSPIEAP